jgi:hypothetical protein
VTALRLWYARRMSDPDDLKRPPVLLDRPFSKEMAAAFRRLGYDVVHVDEPGRSRDADAERLLIAKPGASPGHGGSALRIEGPPDAPQLMTALARMLRFVFVDDGGQIFLYDDGEPVPVPPLDPPPAAPRPKRKAKPRRPLS